MSRKRWEDARNLEEKLPLIRWKTLENYGKTLETARNGEVFINEMTEKIMWDWIDWFYLKNKGAL